MTDTDTDATDDAERRFWSDMDRVRVWSGWGLTAAAVLLSVVSCVWVELAWLNTLLGALVGVLLFVGLAALEG